jgi:phosphatidylglycerophosphate synthase
MTVIRGTEVVSRPSVPSRADQFAPGELQEACADAVNRKNGSFSHPVEKPLLIWIAGRLPAWVSPDQLTVFGLLGAAVAFGGYLLSGRNLQFLWLADLGIVMNWVGDSLDGTLARVRGEEREKYGFFVDHATDLLSQLFIGLGIGLTPFVRFDVACLGLIAYLVLVAYMLIRERAFGTMKISFGMVGPTEVRVGLIALNTWMLYGNPGSFAILHAHFSVIDLVAICAVAAVFVSLPLAIRMEARRIADAPRAQPTRRPEQDNLGGVVRTAPVVNTRDERPYSRRANWRE